jgi:nicotinate-nucleotide adenylyltransferase
VAEPLVLFGGTFDPVHAGHLAVARAARDALGATVHLLPAGDPPHRAAPLAGAAHRLAMLRLALVDQHGLAIDTRELERAGKSRTFDTAAALRDELGPHRPLVLVIGMDSLRTFDTWYRWQDIPALAHLLAVSRPGEALPPPGLPAALAARITGDAADLARSPAGLLLLLQGPAVNIASTAVREALAAGREPDGVAPAVLAYIHRHHLYRKTPEHDDANGR